MNSENSNSYKTEFLERDMHCFTHFNGMGMVHQQFLHALGMVGEHQRADAAQFFTVQPQNIDLEQSEIDQRFSPIKVDDWQNTGSEFDFSSVTLYSFYDFNKKHLDDLTTSWNHNDYSIVRTAPDQDTPIWANRYRASTTDVIQLMDMYPDHCNSASLTNLAQCDNGKQGTVKNLYL